MTMQAKVTSTELMVSLLGLAKVAGMMQVVATISTRVLMMV